MFTIKNNEENEIIIKKSKFISKIYKIKNEDEAKNILNELKKEYKDATHICYAYIVLNSKKAYDDKEPKNTAGIPILNVLEKKDLNYVMLVVIRYFGGIKLGSAGLIRAYKKAALEVVDKSIIIPFIKVKKTQIIFSYDDINNINYILKDNAITYKEFGENVIYEFTYEENKYPKELDKYIITKKDL